MRLHQFWHLCILVSTVSLFTGCATPTYQAYPGNMDPSLPMTASGQYPYSNAFHEETYASRMPAHLATGNQRVIVVNPREYAWGAYDANGELVRGGIAGAGADYCPDDGGPCRTKVGTFRIYSLGDVGCRSRTYPRPEGGALMPYCMFFNGGQSLHGTPDHMLVGQHRSHGCVNIRIPDAEWLRHNFAKVGTKVVILPYE